MGKYYSSLLLLNTLVLNQRHATPAGSYPLFSILEHLNQRHATPAGSYSVFLTTLINAMQHRPRTGERAVPCTNYLYNLFGFAFLRAYL